MCVKSKHVKINKQNSSVLYGTMILHQLCHSRRSLHLLGQRFALVSILGLVTGVLYPCDGCWFSSCTTCSAEAIPAFSSVLADAAYSITCSAEASCSTVSGWSAGAALSTAGGCGIWAISLAYSTTCLADATCSNVSGWSAGGWCSLFCYWRLWCLSCISYGM